MTKNFSVITVDSDNQNYQNFLVEGAAVIRTAWWIEPSVLAILSVGDLGELEINGKAFKGDIFSESIPYNLDKINLTIVNSGQLGRFRSPKVSFAAKGASVSSNTFQPYTLEEFADTINELSIHDIRLLFLLVTKLRKAIGASAIEVAKLFMKKSRLKNPGLQAAGWIAPNLLMISCGQDVSLNEVGVALDESDCVDVKVSSISKGIYLFSFSRILDAAIDVALPDDDGGAGFGFRVLPYNLANDLGFVYSLINNLSAADARILCANILSSIWSSKVRNEDAFRLKSVTRFLQASIKVKNYAAGISEGIFLFDISKAVGLGAEGIFFSGKISDPMKQLQRVEIIDSYGNNIDITPAIINLDSGAFVASIKYPESIKSKFGLFSSPLFFEVRTQLSGGVVYRGVVASCSNDLREMRSEILSSVQKKDLNENMLDKALIPALVNIQREIQKEKKVKDITVFGKLPENPKLTISIPLYKNLDFIQVQIANFAADEWLKENAEVIYVLDSCEDENVVRGCLEALSNLYMFGIKLIVHKNNFGYATANNIAVKYARGEHIILLNADCYPKYAGWSKKLLESHMSRDDAGVTGVRLLFEDETIQHAGIYFGRDNRGYVLGAHLGEGLPGSGNLFKVSEEKEAVTGACMIVKKDLYMKLGGMNTDTIIGDFEDIDFCLKAFKEGCKNYYEADVELYHFQRQSMPHNTTVNSVAWNVNARIHTLRWGKYITENIIK